jgi:hypothetical protein
LRGIRYTRMPLDKTNNKWAWCVFKPFPGLNYSLIDSCFAYSFLTFNSEPCIRGHRSTKCEHWDRFMVMVKSPGRPLSACPHPKDGCQCSSKKVMMVSILRGAYLTVPKLCVYLFDLNVIADNHQAENVFASRFLSLDPTAELCRSP